ncbi:murein L,D-transpeptidase catalytic domain family protein [Bdellovibrio reynosensis]|uniref:Murein L,D-transpeptidase catalytic domain family protein n=1 Tax=Bdellovibrio reynosensis TaxID=2835041 RepID=A0ABY4C8I9_9BACT|nr:murein L,D-transpeptidase catalytic domain family protein [Bdellovibrio reynosensis]UOF01245.1 murein L,D-transpeptidase catalytic domain family protein [Bdellovibrio reynosensis]
MKAVLSAVLTTLLSVSSFAGSLYDVKIKDVSLYDVFKEQGVPEAALQRSFEFLDVNAGKTIRVNAKFRTKTKTYMDEREITIKEDSMAIIDFSKPSNERRLYILNLKTGAVSKHFVAHGKGSGVRVAAKFSNIDGSKMTSLGLYIAGNTYYGGHGESLNLHGLETSNNNAASRDIVIHAASYVSEDYVKSQGRLGRSWGCPAVAPGIIKKVITTFKEGGLIYAYHKDLISSAVKNPDLQEVQPENDDEDIDLPEEEESVRKAAK